MSLSRLPPELLLNVVSHLRGYEVERLARSFNKAVYGACLPRLRIRFASQRNAKEMIRRFSDIGSNPGHCPVYEETYHGLRLNSLFGPFNPQPQLSLEYQELDGDLSWLGTGVSIYEHVADLTGRDRFTHVGENMSSAREAELRGEARRLGFVIPEAFFTLMTNAQLRKRLPPGFGHYFSLGKLRKCSSLLDGGIGGYLIRFLRDGNDHRMWMLYLDPGENKGHCVLGFIDEDDFGPRDDVEKIKKMCLSSGWIANEDLERAKDDGLDLALLSFPDLEGTDFERWLFKFHFDESINLHFDKNKILQATMDDEPQECAPKLTEAQAKYIRYMLTNEGNGIGIGT